MKLRTAACVMMLAWGAEIGARPNAGGRPGAQGNRPQPPTAGPVLPAGNRTNGPQAVAPRPEGPRTLPQAPARLGTPPGQEGGTRTPPGQARAGERLRGSAPAEARAAAESRLAAARGAERTKKMSETQQQNVQHLQDDLAAIQGSSNVSQEQKDAVRNSLTALADGAVKPDPALVEDLATDLAGALADKSLSQKELAALAADVQAVLNSANIPAAEVEQAAADIKALLTAADVSQAELQAVAADLQAIAAEAKNRAAAAAAGRQ